MIDLKKPSNSVTKDGRLGGVKGYLYGLYIKTNMRHIMTFEWYCYFFIHFTNMMKWKQGIREAENFAFHTAIKKSIEKAVGRAKKNRKVFRNGL